MAVFSVFIGVNQFRDPDIRELGGARQDALALWALFGDTIPDGSHRSVLLVDDRATLAAARTALDKSLGAAGPEDTVILSFATHGTPDHHLTFHDTVQAHPESTALPMAEMASRLKHSRAKATLCILDCCFSGAAPARVLDESPVLRNAGTPTAALAGAGRVLIAACAEDQGALENPRTRHGLLTQAVMDAFRVGDGATVDLPAAMSAIVCQVQAEAARLGYAQTPVFHGRVEGTMTLPVLRPGARFFKEFPERRGKPLSGLIEELSAYGIPRPVLVEWKRAFAGGLNRLQRQAVNEFGILEGASLLVVAPTSSGKTFLGEMAAARAVAEGRKAVFLFPYKALVNEKFDQFARVYGEGLGMRVVRCTGDRLDGISPFLRGKYDLAVLTYEMFLHLVLTSTAALNLIGLVVVDETQFVTDERRGITVELLLTHLLMARGRGVAPQLLALSAVIGSNNGFDGWLGCRCLVTGERPVPLTEGVLDRNGIFQEINAAGEQKTTPLLPRHAIVQRGEKPGAQDVIVPLVRQMLGEKANERIIVFRNRRGPAEGCAAYLARDLGLPEAAATLAALPGEDLSTTAATLRRCLAGGTAFHNSNLNRDEREVIERAFRDAAGEIRVLAATTTVAAGINTPASTVILAEQEFIGDDGRPFSVAEYKNMAGRAGRLGYQEEGRAIILAENTEQRQRLFSRYVLGCPEPLVSSFDGRHLETWLLRLLAQIERVQRDDIIGLLANTFGGYLAGRAQPNWRQATEARLQPLLPEMLKLGLLEEETGWLRLSLLGRACGRSSLSFVSSVRLLRILRGFRTRPFSTEHLMATLQVLPESDEVYTPLMKRGQSEARWQRAVADRFGVEVAQTLQQYAGDQHVYWARCKRAMVLADFVDGTPMSLIEANHTPNPYQGKIGAGNVRQFADATRYHLRLAHQIVSLLLLAEAPRDEQIEGMLRRLEIGVPETVLGLLDLPVPLTRGEYLNLWQAGIGTVAEFWTASEERLQLALNAARVRQFRVHRPETAE